jgi:teichuronic acid biosynthesis glycosyltransferase TuaH
LMKLIKMTINNKDMIKGHDIIITSLQSWDIEIGSNCKNIALEFAKNNRVLYINSPLDRATIWRKKHDPQVKKRMEILQGKSGDLVQVKKNLWTLYPRTILESISRIPWNWLFDRGNKINNQRLARQILSAIYRLKFKDPILFNDNNMYRGFYLKEMIHPQVYVYFSRDNLVAMDFWKHQGRRVEPILMQKSDIVVSNSSYLAERARMYNSDSYNVGSGCDLSIYDKTKISRVPIDLSFIPGPIIGYAGVLLNMRLDIEILKYIAISHPEWSTVLIGPEDKIFQKSELHEMTNVYFLGRKDPEELPEYINRFSVAINPQRLNELTVGNYPRKIDEYLALGKPVVALKTEAMSMFEDYVYQATDKKGFVREIERALYENTPEMEVKREEFARAHSWENNVNEIYKAMETFIINHERSSREREPNMKSLSM